MPDPRKKSEAGQEKTENLGPAAEDVLVEPYLGPAYVYNSETRKRAAGKDIWRDRHPESNA